MIYGVSGFADNRAEPLDLCRVHDSVTKFVHRVIHKTARAAISDMIPAAQTAARTVARTIAGTAAKTLLIAATRSPHPAG